MGGRGASKGKGEIAYSKWGKMKYYDEIRDRNGDLIGYEHDEVRHISILRSMTIRAT